MLNSETFNRLEQILGERILLLDGAFGTMVQQLDLDDKYFRWEKLKDPSATLKGCNDILALSNPEIVENIHRKYLEAGADIIKTSSFNTNRISLADYHIEDYVYEIAKASASIARKAADEFTKINPLKPRFVAGSVGPTNKTLSMSADVLDPGKREISFDELSEAYSQQIKGLIDGGADIILIETVFDTLNAKAALYTVEKISEEKGFKIPVMLSVTFSDSSGRTLSGQTVEAFYASVSHANLLSIGMNCAFGAKKLYPWLKRLAEISQFPISVHPNAGLPNVLGRYDETPEKFAGDLSQFMAEGLVNIIGGCCGTTPEHIKALSDITDGYSPRILPEKTNKLVLSNLDIVAVAKESNFINIGERTNVAGSAKFARLIREGNYTDALSVARAQVDSGAQIIDICMDDGMIDGVEAMRNFLNLIASEPEIAKVPIMIDSSNWEVIKAGLKVTQGKSIVNSISLKEGEEFFLERAKEIRRHGAAVVVMLFDERGQADTFERKCEVAKRSYDLMLKIGFPPEDIIFDPNILAVGTGIPHHDKYAKAFIDATKWIKDNLPYAKVSGGVSNLSFAFRGNNRVREAMHSVFLYHAIAAGMDMAIMNPQMVKIYTEIEPRLLEKIEDLILYRYENAGERLVNFLNEDIQQKEGNILSPSSQKQSKSYNLKQEAISLIPVEERIENDILKGNSEHISNDVAEAFDALKDPLAVIDTILMPAMDKVGRLFGEGKMFLPQVVKSARVMKEAVNVITPYLGNKELKGKTGRVIIATVKGDVHDIGKNIVSVVVACNGFDIKDLGVMAEASFIVDEAERVGADAIMLSGLITPSLEEMIKVCRELEKRNLTIPVIIGGATTSAIHTALKIAPEYSGVVVHAKDASVNSKILSELLSSRRESYINEVKRKQEELRKDYFRQHELRQLSTLSEAREGAKWTLKESPAFAEKVREVNLDYDISEIEPFIDWNYFFNSWDIKGKYPEVLESEKYGNEARQLLDDALKILEKLKKEKIIRLQAVIETFKAYREEDDIIIEKVNDRYVLPMLRSQSKENGFRSIADYVAGSNDSITLFALTAGVGLKKYLRSLQEKGDDYEAIMTKLVADRLAEAMAVYLNKKFPGCRFAFGYPSLPDHSMKKDVFRILDVEKETDMRLTQNYMIDPEESICGIIIKGGEYFQVGRIDETQIEDYARRRNSDIDEVKRLLPNNI